MKAARRAGTLLLFAAITACTTPPPLRDLDGSPVHPLAVPPGTVHVIVFTSHECPIANAYAPTLRELAAAWRDLPVQLVLVHVDPELTTAAARRHAADFELPGTILCDGSQRLARRLGVTRTPEAVVLAAGGMTYRGRIDDQWRALGARATTASTHDLAVAVAVTLAGGVPASPFPEAVGCLLPEPAPPPDEHR